MIGSGLYCLLCKHLRLATRINASPMKQYFLLRKSRVKLARRVFILNKIFRGLLQYFQINLCVLQ